MKRKLAVLLCIALALKGILYAQEDIKGAKDHPLVSRMPGYSIHQYEVKDFERYTTAYLPDDQAVWEGKLTRIGYGLREGGKQASMTAIARNYEAAILKAGGKKLYSDERVFGGRVVKNGVTARIHVEAVNEGTSYEVTIVEEGVMQQEVVADARALAAGIAREGKVAVYGILFDTGLAVVKEGSAPVLDEIVKMLKKEAKLRIFVVGHTDGQGTLEMNLKLSADRADAVVRALQTRGIDANRLKPAGVGPYCPVASNLTEEGRAKNRRVELVAR